MHTALECIPCFVRQALEAARFVTDDPGIHERLVREVLRATAEMDLSQSPPMIACRIHRSLRSMTGVTDPYNRAKEAFNRMALAMYEELEMATASSADPLDMAVRLAIAGNVIDLGVNGTLTEAQARASLDNALDEPLCGDTADFRRAMESARNILYLADNAGEIVFDRLLVERLGSHKVTLAVRGGPILNDATIDDAKAAGLCDIVKVIDNGSDAPGTVLGECGDEFRRAFAGADLIISKGQGNFETLSDELANIFFLFKVKCPTIANHVGLPLGSHVLLPSEAGRMRDERLLKERV
jgi:uncharacterized protein with ATP-grasp and redox domains